MSNDNVVVEQKYGTNSGGRWTYAIFVCLFTFPLKLRHAAVACPELATRRFLKLSSLPDRDQLVSPKAPDNGLSDAGLLPIADASSERPYRVSVPEPFAANGAPAVISE